MIDTLGILLVPSGWMAILLGLSLALLPFSGFRRVAVATLLSCTAIYGLFGLGPIVYALLAPLERAYPALTDLSAVKQIDTIVVLTGYGSRNQQLPPGNHLNVSSTYRLVHGLWLLTAQPQPRMLISGSRESAEAMRAVALALGVPSGRVLLDSEAQDTGASAEHMQLLLAGNRCALVTSAGHMPRAMRTFRRHGFKCIPAPIEFYTIYPMSFFDFLPSAHNLMLSDLALHEYLALAWYRVQGRL